MKVTLNIPDSEVQPLLMEHLESGTSVQNKINIAIAFYNKVVAVKKENANVVFGYGDKTNFTRYNHVLEPEGLPVPGKMKGKSIVFDEEE